MLRADLADAGILYQDDAGRYADFHSFRHTTGSLLAASGVHPKLVQSIMRHSDINLTMGRYTHIFAGQEADALAKLPDLDAPSSQAQQATGTDGRPGPDTNSAIHSAKSGRQDKTPKGAGGQGTRDNGNESAFLNGRYRNRTCDPLIKSQLLYLAELIALTSARQRIAQQLPYHH
jgi:Phage integrase family